MSKEEYSAEVQVPTGTMALIHKADIEQQVDTARRYPRSIKRFRDECGEMVTLTEEIAQGCIYALPREGKVIEGPSARFAEVIASAWGNCRAAARVVAEDGEFVTAQGAFHDLERNVAIQYEVRRRITNRKGERFNSDMIAVTANAACSIALRNAILKGIPKSFWADMYEAARKTAMGDAKTLVTRRAEAFESFKRYGISEAQILARLGIGGQEDIGLEELVVLRAIYSSIKDGEVTPENAFAGDEPVKKVYAKLADYKPVFELGRRTMKDQAIESFCAFSEGKGRTPKQTLEALEAEITKSAPVAAKPTPQAPVASPAVQEPEKEITEKHAKKISPTERRELGKLAVETLKLSREAYVATLKELGYDSPEEIPASELENVRNAIQGLGSGPAPAQSTSEPLAARSGRWDLG